MLPVTSGGVRPAIFDRAAGLSPTSPLIAAVGTLVISLAARTANCAAPRKSTAGCAAASSRWADIASSMAASEKMVLEFLKMSGVRGVICFSGLFVIALGDLRSVFGLIVVCWSVFMKFTVAHVRRCHGNGRYGVLPILPLTVVVHTDCGS